MKKIHRFVLKSYVGPMVLTFFIVMFVLMMNFVWRYIDDLVGKGLSTGVIIELLGYSMINMIPMGLPLSTLLAAIMTMGNMGENYELLAMKSAGMSLPKIFKPLIILVAVVSLGSFFVANSLVPYSNRQMAAIVYDIKQQKQALEFRDGTFFNGIDNMSIRVGHQDLETHLLTDLLIYDTSDGSGNMTTTVADSGYIRLSDDKRFLLVTLYNGETYETTRNQEWYTDNALRHHIFVEQNGVIPMSGFDFERTNSDLFNGVQTKDIAHLEVDIDSLETLSDQMLIRSYEPLLRDYLLTFDSSLLGIRDTAKIATGDSKQRHYVIDSLDRLDVFEAKKVWSQASSNAQMSRNTLTFSEDTSKDVLNQLYRSRVEWHRKMSLPVSIMIFFLIGAPLGAIIRRGGLGMPIVVSVLFFVIYYIISIMGEKMAKEGTWGAFAGMWFSSFILFPIAVYLTYKATNDSNLFNVDWYIIKYQKVRGYIKSKINSSKR